MLEVGYRELHGAFEASGKPVAKDLVVLSNLADCAGTSQAANAVCIRYVARGVEHYRIGGTAHRLNPGQVMVAPHDQGAQIEVRNAGNAGALGLCVLLSGSADEWDWHCGPIIFNAAATPLGGPMERTARALWKAEGAKSVRASRLVETLRHDLLSVSREVVRQAAAVDAERPGTRYAAVRRANLARSYLHSLLHRAVSLEELGRTVSSSPFEVLKAFQQCFGESPASYHRKLRLAAVLGEAQRRKTTITALCNDFGFSDASCFSRAHRRAFGKPAVWSKAKR